MSWTLNGTPVCSGELQHPAEGTWTALLQTTDDTAPSGAATLALPGLQLQGTVVQAGTFAGRTTVRLVGGKGKLAQTIPGQHFRGATGRFLAEHLLQAAGEQLDPASDAANLDLILLQWAYFGGSCAGALRHLCLALSCTWWMSAEGRVHLGARTWPASSPAGALVLDVREDLRRLTVALEDEALQPGTTYEGRQVATVDHQLTPRTWRAAVRW